MSKSKKKKRNNNEIGFFVNSNFTVFEVILFIFSSVIFGMIAGCILTYSSSSLSLIRSDSHLNEIINTYKGLSSSFYGDVDKDELTNSAIKGMIESLNDPNSVFLANDVGDEFNDYIDGKYVGIGIDVVIEDEYFVISDVVPNGPADVAGLKIDDMIISINGIDCHNISTSEISSLIRGGSDKYLNLVVKRDEEKLSYKVEREYIDVVNVTDNIYKTNNKKVGYIHISLFSSNTYGQFNDSLKTLQKEKIDSLIIDLRDNPGGHLAQTKKILDLFFKKSTILYQLKNKDSTTKVKASNNSSVSYPIVILINENTASAAEAMTSCFKDNYSNVVVIGTNSYGKGTVQRSMTLNSGKIIKYTIEEWLTPNGKSIDGVGIKPDVNIVNDGDEDLQLKEAINKLK